MRNIFILLLFQTLLFSNTFEHWNIGMSEKKVNSIAKKKSLDMINGIDISSRENTKEYNLVLFGEEAEIFLVFYRHRIFSILVRFNKIKNQRQLKHDIKGSLSKEFGPINSTGEIKHKKLFIKFYDKTKEFPFMGVVFLDKKISHKIQILKAADINQSLP